MASDADRARIERLLAEHAALDARGQECRCACDGLWRDLAAHRAHVAQVLADSQPQAADSADREALERVRALADNLERRLGPFPNGYCYSLPGHQTIRRLRAALDGRLADGGLPGA